jgi:hypothetical protein
VLDGRFECLLHVPVAQVAMLASVECLLKLRQVALRRSLSHGLARDHELDEGLPVLLLELFDVLPDTTRNVRVRAF